MDDFFKVTVENGLRVGVELDSRSIDIMLKEYEGLS